MTLDALDGKVSSDEFRKAQRQAQDFADRWASRVYTKWQSSHSLDFLTKPLQQKLAREQAKKCDWIMREDGFACRRAKPGKRTCPRCRVGRRTVAA